MQTLSKLLNSKLFIVIFLATILLFHGLYLIHTGVGLDSCGVLEGADGLLNLEIEYTKLINPLRGYSGFIAIVAFIKIIMGETAKYGVLGFNLFCDIITALLLVLLIKRVSPHYVPIIIVAILYLLSYEIVLWLSFVLTETAFMLSSFLVLSLSFISFSEKKKQRILLFWGVTFIILFMSFYIRPAFFPLISFYIIALFVFLTFDISDPIKRSNFIRKFALFSCLSVIVLIFYFAASISDSSSYLSNMLLKGGFDSRYFICEPGSPFCEGEMRGIVVNNRPYTYHKVPVSAVDYVLIIADKFLHFFAVFTRDYSLKHKIFNHFFFLPVYGLALITLYEIFRKKSKLSHEEWNLAFLSAIFIIIFALFHSITILDYDWRYRLPCIPPLIVLAGIGSMQLKGYWNDFQKLPAGTKL
jgi:hypothetical protein